MRLAGNTTPLHYALSRKTWKRAIRHSAICKGDIVTIIQLLLSSVPEDMDIEAELKSIGINNDLEVDFELLQIAYDRDDTASPLLLSPDSQHNTESSQKFNENHDENGGSDTTSSVSCQKPRCDVCKTAFQTVSQYAFRAQSDCDGVI